MQQLLLQPLQDRCRDLGPNWSAGGEPRGGKAMVKTSYRPGLVMVQEASSKELVSKECWWWLTES